MKEARCLSLRDPSGRLFELDGRLIRLVLRNTAPEVQAVLAWLHTIQPFVHGRVVGTQTIGEDAFRALLETAPDQLEGLIDEQDPFVLEHEKIQPRSYPFEWPAEMLHHAAELTLDLAEQALAAGLGLKDATPYNIIFDSTEPVFVDLLSFERRVPNDPTWLPYSQFVRSFVLPLLLNKHLNFPLSQSILTNRDGPLPEDAYRWCVSLRMRMKPGLLTSVTIPTWLGRTLGSDPKWLYAKHLTKNSTQASYILKSLFRRLRRVVRQATPVEAKMSLFFY